jgi:hypothetical protein
MCLKNTQHKQRQWSGSSVTVPAYKKHKALSSNSSTKKKKKKKKKNYNQDSGQDLCRKKKKGIFRITYFEQYEQVLLVGAGKLADEMYSVMHGVEQKS